MAGGRSRRDAPGRAYPSAPSVYRNAQFISLRAVCRECLMETVSGILSVAFAFISAAASFNRVLSRLAETSCAAV
jgi:hypothetical protein